MGDTYVKCEHLTSYTETCFHYTYKKILSKMLFYFRQHEISHDVQLETCYRCERLCICLIGGVFKFRKIADGFTFCLKFKTI